MDPLEQLLAERACERLVIDFVHRLDLGRPASVAELFTADGWWEWRGAGGRAGGRAGGGAGARAGAGAGGGPGAARRGAR
ncbi:nuclear transport factor 2 family protein, partial [Streptomyces sp. NPDC059629]|uniref:nuclear transport factor 2 family protein n=1 Tax=Streptomyces sp. NPDC059629 TaxID=3346889 RepID=UPI0036A2B767